MSAPESNQLRSHAISRLIKPRDQVAEACREVAEKGMAVRGVHISGYTLRTPTKMFGAIIPSLKKAASRFLPKSMTFGLNTAEDWESKSILTLSYDFVLIKDLPSNHWLSGIYVTSLRMNFSHLSAEVQASSLAKIDTPEVKEMGLWGIVPSKKTMEVLANKFKQLKELNILYEYPKVCGIVALPDIPSLRAVSLSFSNPPNLGNFMTLPKPLVLVRLECLDLGDVLLGYSDSKVMAPQVKELKVMIPYPVHFLPIQFPNIHTLTYILSDGSTEPYQSIYNFKRLTHLTLGDIPSNPIATDGLIHSTSVTHLTIKYIRNLDYTFWPWLAKGFPNLVHLNIDSDQVRRSLIPANLVNAMLKLKTFTTNSPVSFSFWSRLVKFAPNLAS